MNNSSKIIFIIFHFTIPLFGQKQIEISDKSDNYDSLHFHIHRMYYSSGQTCYESYTDTINKIRHEKNYNLNGKLKVEGDLDLDKSYHIGIWKHYYKNGKFKQISFDSISTVSFYQATQIAKNYGYDESKIEIREEIIKGNYFWNVSCWKEENFDPEIGEFILINRKNKKIIKPKNNKLVRYE